MVESLLLNALKRVRESGVSDGFKYLGRKLLESVVPLAEVAMAAGFLYCVYAFVKSEEAKRHSALLNGSAGLTREKPRDIMKRHFFQNRQGLWLHHDLWWHESYGKPKALVLMLHGHSEHSKRFYHVGEFMNDHGFAVFSLDHQGFGRSEGDRGHVEKFEHYIDDVMDFLQEVMFDDHPEWQDLPRFVMGHSMGGLIGLTAVLHCQASDKPGHNITGIMVSAPAVKVDPARNTWYIRAAGAVIDKLFPKAQLIGFPTYPSTSFLQVKKFSSSDPLNYHGKVRVHQGLELLRGTQTLLELAPSFETPVFIFHGQEDLHADISGSRKFISLISSEDKTLHELPGLRHEPLQEEKEIRDQVLNMVADWALQRVNNNFVKL